MVASCLIGVMCGLLLGARFKVFAIVPVQILALLGFGVLVMLDRLSLGHAALVFVCWSASLQFAYVVMLVVASKSTRSFRGLPFKA